MMNKTGWALAVLAFVFAASGTAVAAKLITGKQIKDRSIASRDLASRSVTPSKLSDSSVEMMIDAAKDEIPAGPQGAPGPAGPAGAPGPSAMAKATKYVGSATVPAGDIGTATAFCPAGNNAVTGGWFASIGDAAAAGLNDARSAAYLIVSNYDNSISINIEATAWCVPTGSAYQASTRRAMIQRTERQIQQLVDRLRAAHQKARAKR